MTSLNLLSGNSSRFCISMHILIISTRWASSSAITTTARKRTKLVKTYITSFFFTLSPNNTGESRLQLISKCSSFFFFFISKSNLNTENYRINTVCMDITAFINILYAFKIKRQIYLYLKKIIIVIYQNISLKKTVQLLWVHPHTIIIVINPS